MHAWNNIYVCMHVWMPYTFEKDNINSMVLI